MPCLTFCKRMGMMSVPFNPKMRKDAPPDIGFWSGMWKLSSTFHKSFQPSLRLPFGDKKENTKRCLYSLLVYLCCQDDELSGAESVIGLKLVWRAYCLLGVTQQPSSRLQMFLFHRQLFIPNNCILTYSSPFLQSRRHSG